MDENTLANLIIGGSLGLSLGLAVVALGIWYRRRQHIAPSPAAEAEQIDEGPLVANACPLCGDDLDAIDPTGISAFLARKAMTAINDIPGVTAQAHFRADGSGLCIVEDHDVTKMSQADFARISLLHWREAPIHVTARNGDEIILSPGGHVSRHKEAH